MTEPDGLLAAAATSGGMATHVLHTYGPQAVGLVAKAIRLTVEAHPDRGIDCDCAALAALGALLLHQRNQEKTG